MQKKQANYIKMVKILREDGSRMDYYNLNELLLLNAELLCGRKINYQRMFRVSYRY